MLSISKVEMESQDILKVIEEKYGLIIPSFKIFWEKSNMPISPAILEYFKLKISKIEDYWKKPHYEQFILLGIDSLHAEKFTKYFLEHDLHEFKHFIIHDWIESFVFGYKNEKIRELKEKFKECFMKEDFNESAKIPFSISVQRGGIVNPISKTIFFDVVDSNKVTLKNNEFLYHGTSFENAVKILSIGPLPFFSCLNYDFNSAFYLSFDLDTAKNWAMKKFYDQDPVVLVFKIEFLERLNILNLDERQASKVIKVFRNELVDVDSLDTIYLYSHDAVYAPILMNPDLFVIGEEPEFSQYQLAIFSPSKTVQALEYFQIIVKV